MTTSATTTAPYAELAAAMRGDLITSGDPGYDQARAVYNAMIDGLQWYWRADFFNEISDAAIEVHVKYGAQLPTGHSTMHLYPVDGAASRVPADATAFAYRDGGYNGIIVGSIPTRPTPASIPNGPRTTGRSCTRPRLAAPTSTS
jgi:hypothetical protein